MEDVLTLDTKNKTRAQQPRRTHTSSASWVTVRRTTTTAKKMRYMG